jgi:hypothetical protein
MLDEPNAWSLLEFALVFALVNLPTGFSHGQLAVVSLRTAEMGVMGTELVLVYHPIRVMPLVDIIDRDLL